MPWITPRAPCWAAWVDTHQAMVLTSCAGLTQAAMEWRRLRQCVENGVRLPATVHSTNQNGLIVNLMGVDGFIPLRYVDKVTHHPCLWFVRCCRLGGALGSCPGCSSARRDRADIQPL